MSQLSEDLIISWMQFNAMMEKRALVEGLSFNEALVCNLLGRGCGTASELCERTKILKSQMNAILRSLEKRGIITRSPSDTDRRKVVLRFTEEGRALYDRSHRHTLAIIDALVEKLGEEEVGHLIPAFRRAAETFDELSTEVN